ncbi:tetratricopeptide repeat protein [Maridesulfovibrio sp.]|uniref:tetratricopeptide repeat protein n=1 Tax=Maridesulfovibrio sp. TaxID=2795000 RepID=UPI0029F56955|nr:tetratricopeptide repeat protein [Maridesulfovibrio sp.]|eukprot:GCRY01009807.1.p1 GENE.GCRY01009807.1~~GCRY01009807.1.p1  ORF type:complete len:105 (+),score=12.68 GCRY01009807.1:33-347(+)
MCNLGKAWQLNREGMQACNKGDFEKAENNLKTAIQMSQCKSKKIHRATLHNNLAVVLQMSGKVEEAVKAYDLAIGFLNPGHKGQAALIERIESKKEELKQKLAA